MLRLKLTLAQATSYYGANPNAGQGAVHFSYEVVNGFVGVFVFKVFTSAFGGSAIQIPSAFEFAEEVTETQFLNVFPNSFKFEKITLE